MEDETLIRATIGAYLTSYEAHDAAGCAAIYEPDALILSPWGPPAHGALAISAAHEEWFGEGKHNKVMTIEDILVDGNLAVCLLRYRAEVPVEGSSNEAVYGASVNALQRQKDGNWKIRYTSLNELEDEKTGFEG